MTCAGSATKYVVDANRVDKDHRQHNDASIEDESKRRIWRGGRRGIRSGVNMREFNSSWSDGAAKRAITDLSRRLRHKADRTSCSRWNASGCSTTTGAEQPMYFQLAFPLGHLKTLAPQHLEWKDQQPFKTVLEGDMKTIAVSGRGGLLGLAMATHSGMTTS
jgi:hypothetical protein